MLTCPKCTKTFDDDSKICRDWGAILEPLESSQLEPTVDDLMESALQGDQEEAEAEWEQKPWHCPHCKEAIEADFDVCWNCGTNRSGQPDPGFVSVRSDSEALEPKHLDYSSRKVPHGDACPRCGSRRVISNAYLGESGPHHFEWKVTVNVEGDPKAWIFKDTERAELKADICGQCGHVELKVTNAALLYEHYLKSIEDRQK